MMYFAVALRDNRKLIATMMDIFIKWNLVVIEKIQALRVDFITAYNDMAWKEGPLVSPQVFMEVFLLKMKIVADTIKVLWGFHSEAT